VSAVTVTYRDAFALTKGRRADLKAKEASGAAPRPAEPTCVARPSRIARNLALAYWIERRIEDGSLKGYADAARQLGVTRARVAQIVDLALLPPPVQEALLLARAAHSCISHREPRGPDNRRERRPPPAPRPDAGDARRRAR
jgi:hypothetical protein